MRSRRYCKTPGPVSSLILAFSAPATPLLLPVALFRALVVSLPASRMGVGAATIPAVRLIPLPVPSPPRLRLWFLPPRYLFSRSPTVFAVPTAAFIPSRSSLLISSVTGHRRAPLVVCRKNTPCRAN